MKGLRLALRAFRRITDFRGRATRAELLAFYILALVVSAAVGLAASLALDGRAPGWIAGGTAGAFLVPGVSLCVRRLHDSGWSGWWLLLFAPAIGLGVLQQHLRMRAPYPFLQPDLPWFVELPAATSGLALLAMLLWDDEAGANRYGPNPRTGPGGEPV